MTLFGPFDRRVAFEIGPVLGRSRPGEPVVPARAGPPPTRLWPSTRADARRLDVARFLTGVLLGECSNSEQRLARLESVVDENVDVWSPSLHTTSRCQLVAALVEHDDAVTDIVVEIEGEAVRGARAFVEWRVTGRFDNAGFLNDEVLVEPSHAAIETAGVLVVRFERDRVTSVHCFYDGLALLEQVLTPPAGDAPEC